VDHLSRATEKLLAPFFAIDLETMMSRTSFLPTLTAALLFGVSPILAQDNVVRIDEPKVDGIMLDWCRRFGEKCGQPAADAFCRANDYRRSVRFVQWIDPGKPTKVISNGQICDSEGCDSFRWIECLKKR
jgi:hypothetical protein